MLRKREEEGERVGDKDAQRVRERGRQRETEELTERGRGKISILLNHQSLFIDK